MYPFLYVSFREHTYVFLLGVYTEGASTMLSGEVSTGNAGDTGDLGSIPGLGRTPGEGNGTPLQYSCLENPMDRGAWWVTVHGIAKSQTRPSMSMTYRRGVNGS